MDKFINKVFHANCLKLLSQLPDESIDSVIADPMYGNSKKPSKSITYDWGLDRMALNRRKFHASPGL